MIRCCLHTKNPCGTDTWMVGHTCSCVECVAWLAECGIQPYGAYVTCQHGHLTVYSYPCPHCGVSSSIAPVKCGACYKCLHDLTKGFANPTMSRMILCVTCGNKRCPKATDHNNACSGSNEPGQPGSRY